MERGAPPHPLFTPDHNKLLAAWSVRYLIGFIPQTARHFPLNHLRTSLYGLTAERKEDNHIQRKGAHVSLFWTVAHQKCCLKRQNTKRKVDERESHGISDSGSTLRGREQRASVRNSPASSARPFHKNSVKMKMLKWFKAVALMHVDRLNNI